MKKENFSVDSPIGFFDSGVGGISVLREAIKIMPSENYIYYGDSKNAPYGTKSVEEIKRLSYNVVDFLLEKGVKGIVVACNTATSAVVAELRKKYIDFPIVGIEPAVKPAVNSEKEGKIVVMATPMTIAQEKFHLLLDRLSGDRLDDVIPLPCKGLVEFVESGNYDSPEVEAFLKEKFDELKDENIATVVLGCTHYPFVKKAIAKILGSDVDIIDGSLGTSKEIKRRLAINGVLKENNQKGEIEVYNSSNDQKIIDLSYKLIAMKEMS